MKVPLTASGIVSLALFAGSGLSAESGPIDATQSALKPIAWCAPEIASGHISLGRVKVTHPVHCFDAGVGADYRPLGYALVGVWSLTDLSRAYRDSRKPFWNEIDPIVLFGRRQELADGYALDSCAGAQWNYMAGYEGDARRSYDEWQVRETLTTPFVTPWFSMRNFYWPVAKASFRAGLTRTFALSENLTLVPNIWVDGGGERWNEQRFGYKNPKRIGRGLNSLSARLFAFYRLGPWAQVFCGVTGYCATDPDVRAELKDNPSDEARHLYALVSCGVRFEL